MNAGTFDIYVDKQSEFYIEFEYVDANDNPIPITELVTFEVRRSSIVNKNLFSLYSDGNISDNDEFYNGTDYVVGDIIINNNIAKITIYTNTISRIYPNQYFYYLKLHSTDDTKTLLKGKFVTDTP
jgi:hypothetical protein